MRYTFIIFSVLSLLLCAEASVARCCPGPGCPGIIYDSNISLLKLQSFIVGQRGTNTPQIAITAVGKFIAKRNAMQLKCYEAVNDMLLNTNYKQATCERIFSALNVAPRAVYDDLNASNIKILQTMWHSQHNKQSGVSNYKAFLNIGKKALAQKKHHLARFCFRFAAYSSEAGQLLAKVNGKLAS